MKPWVIGEVVTYIQSGNVIFSADRQEGHEARIQEAILSQYGWEVPVMVTKAKDLQRILDECPFEQAKKEKAYYMILKEKPAEEDIRSLDDLSFESDEFLMGNGCIYLFSEAGYGKSKLSNTLFERRLKVPTTTRNYKTMTKLISLST